MTNLLEIKDLAKTFYLYLNDKRIEAIRQVDLCVKPSEFVGIIGKSGSGKSTILKTIIGTYLASSGQVWYESDRYGRVDLTQVPLRQLIDIRTREIGYVSQFFQAIPRTTARVIIEQALKESGRPGDPETEAIRLLRHFEIEETLWDVYPRTFSGGEKLRLNIARAMIKQPRLLLLDEPTASLDHASKVKVRELMEILIAQGTTMLGIFHDIEFMQGLTNRVYTMDQGVLK